MISGSAENEEFYESTPDGSVHLSVLNAPASALFKEGCEYYVDFTEAATDRSNLANDSEEAERLRLENERSAADAKAHLPIPHVADDTAARISRAEAQEATEEASRAAEVDAETTKE